METHKAQPVTILFLHMGLQSGAGNGTLMYLSCARIWNLDDVWRKPLSQPRRTVRKENQKSRAHVMKDNSKSLFLEIPKALFSALCCCSAAYYSSKTLDS